MNFAPVVVDLATVSKVYDGGVTALRDVSLTIVAGELVAIVGPSGSGKSTMLHLIGTLDRPSAGTVRIEGHDVAGLSDRQLSALRARRIGFVFQQFHLVPYLSVLDNVLAAALACPLADARKRADYLLARFGLTSRCHHVPAELSTGERQRTALARALLHRPKLLLADEPTGNLDPDNGRLVLDALADHASSGGAVLLVTHEPEAAARAHRVVTFDHPGVLGGAA